MARTGRRTDLAAQCDGRRRVERLDLTPDAEPRLAGASRGERGGEFDVPVVDAGAAFDRAVIIHPTVARGPRPDLAIGAKGEGDMYNVIRYNSTVRVLAGAR